MFIIERAHRITIFSRANLVKLSAVIIALWLIIILCTKGLTHSIEQLPPLIHDNGHLIIPEQSPLRHAVVIKRVIKQRFVVPLTLPATVEADPARLLSVLSPVLGQITQIDKQLGDYVNAGDILFCIRSADFAQAVSDVQKASAMMVFSKQNFERQKQLIASQISSVHDTQQAKNDYEQAVSELARANSRLKELHANPAFNYAQSILTVKSPISGYVTELNAAVGGYWNDATRPVMIVADLTSVFITANLQEKDMAAVYLDQPVKIKLDAYSEPIYSKIHYISPILNPDTRTVDIGILYDNKKALLKPNMFAKAELIGRPRDRILLPLTAVVQRGFDSLVFVEIASWTFEARVVQVGPQLDNNIEIVSGLTSGERVAITGGIILND